MARNLADSLIIPFNVSDYAVTIENQRKTLFKDFESLMTQHGIDIGEQRLDKTNKMSLIRVFAVRSMGS